ncbi:hypothetical protein BC831DRAFT_549502 [Entophlyctis helioformis]|nr:hypothetical protein BC831DRAFT_549502 [Entophlyctis helioformis]
MVAATRLADVRPGDLQLRLTVKVLETLVVVSSHVPLKDGTECAVRVAQVLVGDESAVGILELVDDDIDRAAVGQVYELRNVWAKMSHGFVRLRSEPMSALPVAHVQAAQAAAGGAAAADPAVHQEQQDQQEQQEQQDAAFAINYEHNISSIEYERTPGIALHP